MRNKNNVVSYILGVFSTLLIFTLVLLILGVRVVTAPKYERLMYFEENYEKADLLKKEIISKYYLDVDEETIEIGMYKGMFDSIDDKYSRYMTADELEEYYESTDGRYVGIGILSDLSDDKLLVKRVFDNSPAIESGIEVGDLIIEVDGITIDEVGNSGLIDIMLGDEDTDIEVVLFRNNKKIVINMKRRKVVIPFISSSEIGNIGYINIYRFGRDSAKEFKSHLKELQKSNIEGLVIDVRNNPGGLVSECVDIADLIIGKGIIVYTLDRNGKRKDYKSNYSKINIPVVMIANENSASASEILLGALQDAEDISVIGVQTFGKGIVQSTTKLKDDSGYKITFSQYFTPNDREIHKIGITPDYFVEYTEKIDTLLPDTEKDLQLIKALEVLRGEMDF